MEQNLKNHMYVCMYTYGLPWWLCGNPWVGKTELEIQSPRFPWRRSWQPTPVSLPGKSHGQRDLGGYSSWSHKGAGRDLETKQRQCAHTCINESFAVCLQLTLYCKSTVLQLKRLKNIDTKCCYVNYIPTNSKHSLSPAFPRNFFSCF